MDIQNILSHETARQNIYNSFVNCYHMPGEEIRATLDILSKQLSALDSKALSHINLMRDEEECNFDVELLRIEFTRLFIGPYSLPSPPYGSIYIEKMRKVMGDSTMDAQKRYRHFGLDVSRNFKDVPDHITVELEFMFFLIFKEIENIKSGEAEQAQELLYHQKMFLADHLSRWIPDFTDSVIEYSGTEFYRNLARAIRVFIAEDLEYLENISMPVTQE